MTSTTEQTVINMKQKPIVENTVVVNEPINSQQVSLETVVANVDNLIVNDVKNEKMPESDQLLTRGISKKASTKKSFKSAIPLVTVVIMIIPLLQLIIGWHYANKCPFNWHIPHYLVVSGVIGLILITLNAVLDFLASHAKSMLDDATVRASHCGACCGMCGLLIVISGLIIFLVGWSIAGCIWVFRAWNKIQYENPDRYDYCHPTLYRFAYWLFFLSITYILFSCCRMCTQAPKQITNKTKGPVIPSVIITEA
ncbi:unnamed protein product [Rotaria sp. Silwood1]|nr:unnamed protein product [Rotaria sp. Silwood1]CAF0742479.1 unnamed protein product [Rotaria sp. Silwood1]CAF3350555.1 unnamed protein product [Rotaria sp. Silwood1]